MMREVLFTFRAPGAQADGVLQAGAELDVVFTVKNETPHPATGLVVELTGTVDTVQLPPKRPLRDLAPGETSEQSFTVKVASPIADGADIIMQALLIDSGGGTAGSNILRYHAASAPKLDESSHAEIRVADEEASAHVTLRNTGTDVARDIAIAVYHTDGSAPTIETVDELLPGMAAHRAIPLSFVPPASGNLHALPVIVTPSGRAAFELPLAFVPFGGSHVDRLDVALAEQMLPGSLNELTVNFTNTGTNRLFDGNLVVTVPTGLTVVEGSARVRGVPVGIGSRSKRNGIANGTISVGDVEPGEEVTATVTLLAGEHRPKALSVRVQLQTGAVRAEETVSTLIVGTARLDRTRLDAPATVTIGRVADLSVVIINDGDAWATGLIARLITTLGKCVDLTVGDLGPGATKALTMRIPISEARAFADRVSIVLDVVGNDGVKATSEAIVTVLAAPRLKLSLDLVDVGGATDKRTLRPGETGNVSVRVENAGNERAEGVSINLAPLYGAPVKSDVGTTVVLGSIQPGESLSAFSAWQLTSDFSNRDAVLDAILFADNVAPHHAATLRMPTFAEPNFETSSLTAMAPEVRLGERASFAFRLANTGDGVPGSVTLKVQGLAGQCRLVSGSVHINEHAAGHAGDALATHGVQLVRPGDLDLRFQLAIEPAGVDTISPVLQITYDGRQHVATLERPVRVTAAPAIAGGDERLRSTLGVVSFDLGNAAKAAVVDVVPQPIVPSPISAEPTAMAPVVSSTMVIDVMQPEVSTAIELPPETAPDDAVGVIETDSESDVEPEVGDDFVSFDDDLDTAAAAADVATLPEFDAAHVDDLLKMPTSVALVTQLTAKRIAQLQKIVRMVQGRGSWAHVLILRLLVPDYVVEAHLDTQLDAVRNEFKELGDRLAIRANAEGFTASGDELEQPNTRRVTVELYNGLAAARTAPAPEPSIGTLITNIERDELASAIAALADVMRTAPSYFALALLMGSASSDANLSAALGAYRQRLIDLYSSNDTAHFDSPDGEADALLDRFVDALASLTVTS